MFSVGQSQLQSKAQPNVSWSHWCTEKSRINKELEQEKLEDEADEENRWHVFQQETETVTWVSHRPFTRPMCLEGI